MEIPEIDKYAGLNSLIHQLDPRLKIISFLFLIFSVVLLQNLWLIMLSLGFAIFLMMVSRLPLGFVFRYLRWVMLFSLAILIIMAFTVGGNNIGFFPIGVSPEGLTYGVSIATKALTASIFALIIPMTTRFEIMLKSFEYLRVPNYIVQMFMFTYRYIFLLSREYEKMHTASKIRGFKFKTKKRSFEILGYMLGYLFIRSYERAERVYQAMRSRGYIGTIKIFTEFNIRNRDYFIAGLLIIFALNLHLSSLFVK